MGHPAHFHLLKNVYHELVDTGYDVKVAIKNKDILQELLNAANIPFANILSKRRKSSFFSILKAEYTKWKNLSKICNNFKPDIILGTSSAMPFVGKINHASTIMLSEDDAYLIKKFALISYPFTDTILSPSACNNGRWNHKTVFYNGYQKLAYLHPNRFTPKETVVKKYFQPQKPYVLMRLSSLDAHHDGGVQGFSEKTAENTVRLINKSFDVYITSERPLTKYLEAFKLIINPLDIHHLLAHAALFIGDSQSMAVEAAMLGTPSVRFSSFAGKIGVLEELEHKYQLTFGVKPNNPDELFRTISDIVNNPNNKKHFIQRRHKMLKEKIDFSAFLVWFVENYPESKQILKENPEFQNRFVAEA